MTGRGEVQRRSVEALVAEAAALLTAAGGSAEPAGRVLLGLTGAPGAGKSTLCALLLDRFGADAAAVPMDGFHLDNPVLEALGRRDRKGAPDTFDPAGYAALLRRLRDQKDETVYAPRFDRATETAVAAALPVPAGVRLVIAEGNYLLHDRDGWAPIRGLLDQVWYLDVPPAERVARLVGRRVADGHDPQEARDWVEVVDQRNAAVVEAGRDRADRIIEVTGPRPGQDQEDRT